MWNNLLSNAFNANSVDLQLVNSSNHTFTNFNVNVSQLSNYDIDVISNVNQYDVYIIGHGELIYSSDIGGYSINVYHPNVFNYFNYDIAIDLDVDLTIFFFIIKCYLSIAQLSSHLMQKLPKKS